jgi:hypothetical protein
MESNADICPQQMLSHIKTQLTSLLMRVSTRNLALLNIAALVAVLILNYLSNALPLNGKTPGQLSDQYPNLFVPAGLTFSIWGIIYTWLLAWSVWQVMALLTPQTRTRIEPALQKIGLLFVSTCLYNIGWLLAWHWEQVLLSVLVMAMLFLRLLRLNVQSGAGIHASSDTEKWLMHAPFGLYWGWISIALIANVTALLVQLNWGRFGQSEGFWAIAMIVAGSLIATAVVWTRNHIFYGLAVVWALYGIWMKRTGAPEVPESASVAMTALAGMAITGVAVMLRLKKWLNY